MKFKLLAMIAIACCLSTMAFAQEFTGHVADSSGAVIPKAQIVVHNQRTGVDISTTATGSGVYTVPYLKPGTYTVSASAPEFKKESKPDIKLEVGQTMVVNFTLPLGATTQTVTVSATGQLLNTGNAELGDLIGESRVTELPLNGGDPGMLAILSPGVAWTGSLQFQRPFDGPLKHLQINGTGGSDNEEMLDGMINETGNLGSAYVPPVDAVREFRIITTPYNAKYGNMHGGVVDMALKSGTNRLHGDAYEYARRTWLDANTWQNDWLASKNGNNPLYARPQMKWDQYGGELNGPIYVPKLYDGRNKSFFYVGYQKFDEIQPESLVTSVPSPQWLTGNFSNDEYWDGARGYQPVTIYDPLTLHKNSKGVYVRDPFPGNIIPEGRINPVARKLLSYYPKPNLTPPAGTNPFSGNYSVPAPEIERYRNVLGKWDQNFSSHDRFSLRYGYWERIEEQDLNGMPGAAAFGHQPYGERSQSFVAEWVHTFTPNLLLNFRSAVVVRNNYAFYGTNNFDEASLGWSPSMVAQFKNNGHVFPRFNPGNGYASLGSSGGSSEVSNNLDLFPSITWIKGKQTIQAGLDMRYAQYGAPVTEGGPEIGSGGMWTQADYISSDFSDASGNSMAGILLGLPQSGSMTFNTTEFESFHYIAGCLQDNWSVTPKLILNLGIRYDVDIPVVERNNQGNYIFDTKAINPVNDQINHGLMPDGEAAKGGITFLGVGGNPRSPWSTNWTDIQPRVGFAFAPRDNLVIRGGIGETYGPPDNSIIKDGYSSTTSYVRSLDGDKTPNPESNLSNPFPFVIQPIGSSLGMLTNLGRSMSFINPHYRVPSYWTYSLGFGEQFGSRDMIGVSYVGSRSHNGTYSDDINRESEAYSIQCNIEMGGNPDTCLNDFPKNPFYHVEPFKGTGYYTAKTIQGGNLTRPFPEFGSITEDDLNGFHSWYNALQVTGLHRWSGAFTMNATWTWSKLMNAGGWTDETYRVPSRHLSSIDFPNRVTLSAVYNLPVGRGRKFLSSANRLVDGVLGGWELSPIYIYETGAPWPVPTSHSQRYVHNAWVPRHIEKSTGYIRGVAACASEWKLNDKTGKWSLQPFTFNYSGTCTQPDFIANPLYGSLTNTVYTGIRLPNDQQFDASLAKNFALVGRMKLQLRIEAFNVLNHPLWQEGYQGSAASTNFGTIERGVVGQSNLPRETQLVARVTW